MWIKGEWVEEPIREFDILAPSITTEELTCIRDAAVTGHMIGHYYLRSGCGCFYGTLAKCRTGVHTDGDNDDVGTWKDELLNLDGDGFKTSTPLEEMLWPVNIGDTPETSDELASLVGWINRELATRQA